MRNMLKVCVSLYLPYNYCYSIYNHLICSSSRNDGDGSLYSCLVEEPIKMMKKWLNCSSLYSTHILEGRRRYVYIFFLWNLGTVILCIRKTNLFSDPVLFHLKRLSP